MVSFPEVKYFQLTSLGMPSSHNIIQCTYSTERLKCRGRVKLDLHSPSKIPHHKDTEDVAESRHFTAVLALTAGKE